MIYCDTSVLLSLYCGDDFADLATEWFDFLDEAVAWTSLHELEFLAGLEARVGRGQTLRGEADAIQVELRAHLGEGGFLSRRVPRSWARVMERAKGLVASWGAGFQSRTLDSLHVANCLELELSELWTFDLRQARLARAAGPSVRTREEDY